MSFDYILTGKKIYTLNDSKENADWIAVKDGKIVEVGTGNVPGGCELKEFPEGIIIPGLIDSHVHAGNTAIMLSGVSMIDVTSVGQALKCIEERCLNTEDDIVFAPFFIPQQVKEQRFPNRKELDSVSHGKKVIVICITLHSSSVNTAAIDFVGINDIREGMGIDEDGCFNGELLEDEINFYVMSNLVAGISDEKYEKYIDDFGNMCAKNGITSAHCLEGQFMAGDRDIPIWLNRIEKNELPFHCVLYPQVWDYQQALAYGLPRHGGCLTLDGADMDYTMALDEPYTCKPEVRGNLFRKDSEVYNLVSKAYADNKQTAFHAMGDRAIDQLLDAYRRVIAEQGQKNLRLRIEHFTMPRPSHLKLASELGVVVSQQPEFPYIYDTEDGYVEEWFGKERVKRIEQYKQNMDAGIMVAGGSDSPVNSINPLTGIHGVVNGRFDTRRMDVKGALKMYTYNAAYAAFEEQERGTIKEGFYADFTILGQDPYEIPDKINEIEVIGTISEGRVVYAK